MIRFRAWNIEFRLHALTLITAALAYLLGVSNELPVIAMAVGLHELMHILAARACRLDIEYIEIMPFGGAAHIRDIYSASRMALIITAAAGPAANLLAALAGAALAWWEVLGFYQAAVLIRINLMLMLFNLMPALPLDGGRILYAIATVWLKPRTALRIGVGFAHVLALTLVAATVAIWNAYGIVNITFIILAVFLIASSLGELKAAQNGGAARALAALCGDESLPARAQLVLMPADASVDGAAQFMRPGAAVLYAIVDDDEVRRFVTGGGMAKQIINGK